MEKATITAKLNGRTVYRRTLKDYGNRAGLDLAIENAVKHDFKNYDCTVAIEEVWVCAACGCAHKYNGGACTEINNGGRNGY